MTRLERSFREFDEANPELWELIQKYAFRAMARGHKHYGMKALFEVIRWHTSVETSRDDFKVNNNYTAFYVRKFDMRHPHLAGFFRTRESVADSLLSEALL